MDSHVTYEDFRGQEKTMPVRQMAETLADQNLNPPFDKDQDGRFKDVIYGEDYDMFNKAAVDMRSDCDQPYDIDFGRKNAAVTYIWLR